MIKLGELLTPRGFDATKRTKQQRLSAVAGVYCILHSDTGDMYVGSTYGNDGIWGRQVLPSSATKDEVVAVESLMKEKLGTRVFGANAN